jgi:hypothetical protein
VVLKIFFVRVVDCGVLGVTFDKTFELHSFLQLIVCFNNQSMSWIDDILRYAIRFYYAIFAFYSMRTPIVQEQGLRPGMRIVLGNLISGNLLVILAVVMVITAALAFYFNHVRRQLAEQNQHQHVPGLNEEQEEQQGGGGGGGEQDEEEEQQGRGGGGGEQDEEEDDDDKEDDDEEEDDDDKEDDDDDDDEDPGGNPPPGGGAAQPGPSVEDAPDEGDNRTGRKSSKTTKKEELEKRRGPNGRFGKKRLAQIINFLRSKLKRRDRHSSSIQFV